MLELSILLIVVSAIIYLIKSNQVNNNLENIFDIEKNVYNSYVSLNKSLIK